MKICEWCAVRISWWRKYCKPCKSSLTGSAGLYLQTGGPPFSQYSRLDPAIVEKVFTLYNIRKRLAKLKEDPFPIVRLDDDS